MVETVKAVTGLNLEYSRFNMPEKDNPFVTATTANPDCACYPNESQYQFPLNWDTGPETLDVYYYPINHSGSAIPYFNVNGLNLNVAYPGYNPTKNNYLYNQNIGGASCLDAVENPTVTITLTKTDNVFRDYPNIPQKCILADMGNLSSGYGYYNPIGSFNVYHSTHSRISRKCWAGTGNLGTDKILVIYTYSQDSVSLVVCYLNNAVNGFMDSNDASKYPHAVFIPLGSNSPADYLGGPIIYDYTFTGGLGGYGFNDSNFYFYFNAPYYAGFFITEVPINNYYYTNAYNAFGNSSTSFNYGQLPIDGSLTYGYYRTINDIASNTPCVPNSTHWLCYSGRPQIKNFGSVAATSQYYNEPNPTPEQRFVGSGVDAESYFVIFWNRQGGAPGTPGGRVHYPCNWNGPAFIDIEPGPSCPADDPIDWSNPWVVKYTDPQTQQVHYELTAVLASMQSGTAHTGTFGNNYLINTSISCSQAIKNSLLYYGINLNGGGSWSPNPAPTGDTTVVNYPGGPVNHVTLGDGSVSYQTLELVNVGSATQSISLFATSIELANLAQSLYCQYKDKGLGLNQNISDIYGTLDIITEVVTYKVTHHNVPVDIGYSSLGGSSVNLKYESIEQFLSKNPVINIPGVLNPPWLGDSYEYEFSNIADFNKHVYTVANTAATYTYEVYPGGKTFQIKPCYYAFGGYSEGVVPTPDVQGIVKKYKGAYIPYFLAGVRPGGGIKYPSNITEPKVRIYTTEEYSPEDYYESNYPKRFFTEFDPSLLAVTQEKELVGTNTFEGNTYEVKQFYPDLKNVTTVSTGLPRMQSAFQYLVMQPEEGECAFKMAAINDFAYYLPYSYAISLMTSTNNKMGIPEEYFQCKSSLVYQPPVSPGGYNWPGATSAAQAGFLFDPSYGAMQLKTSINRIVGVAPNAYYSSSLTERKMIYFPKLFEKALEETYITNYVSLSNTSKSYLQGYTYLQGNPLIVFTLSTVKSLVTQYGNTYEISTCGVAMPTSVINGDSDLCGGVKIITCNNGLQDISYYAGESFKKITPEYYLSTQKQLYVDQNQPMLDAFAYYKSRVSENTAVSFPVEKKYSVLSGVKQHPQNLGGGFTHTFTEKTYNEYIVFSKLAYFGNIYQQSWNNVGQWGEHSSYNTALIPSTTVVTVNTPRTGTMHATFLGASPWLSYTFGSANWSFFAPAFNANNCETLGVNLKLNERKISIGKTLTYNMHTGSPYFFYLYAYQAYGTSSLEIADVQWTRWFAGFTQEIEKNTMCENNTNPQLGATGILWIMYSDEKHFYVDKFLSSGSLPTVSYPYTFSASDPSIPFPGWACQDFTAGPPGNGYIGTVQQCTAIPTGNLTWYRTAPDMPDPLSVTEIEHDQRLLRKSYGLLTRYYS